VKQVVEVSLDGLGGRVAARPARPLSIWSTISMDAMMTWDMAYRIARTL